MKFNTARNTLAIMFYGTEAGKKINTILNQVDENPWQMGKPTQEGMYLVLLDGHYHKDTTAYMVALWRNNGWRMTTLGSSYNLENEVIAWQRIEPFEEEAE